MIKLKNEEKINNSVYYPLIYRYVSTVVENFTKDVLAVVLFGSVARNTARPDSDIDMMILLKERSKEVERKLLDIDLSVCKWDETQQLLDKGIYTKIFAILKTESELRNNPLILLDILDHGVILYDPEKKFTKLLSDLDKKLKELKAEKIVFEDSKWCWDLKPDWKPGEVVEIKL